MAEGRVQVRRVELQGPRQAEALSHLRGLAKDGRLTLLTATRQPEISEAAVLAALLRADTTANLRSRSQTTGGRR